MSLLAYLTSAFQVHRGAVWTTIHVPLGVKVLMYGILIPSAVLLWKAAF